MNFDGLQHWWMTPFGRRWPSMEDNLRRKKTSDGGHPDVINERPLTWLFEKHRLLPSYMFCLQSMRAINFPQHKSKKMKGKLVAIHNTHNIQTFINILIFMPQTSTLHELYLRIKYTLGTGLFTWYFVTINLFNHIWHGGGGEEQDLGINQIQAQVSDSLFGP